LNVVSCQTQIFVMGRSLIQGSSTECGGPECGREASMVVRPSWGFPPQSHGLKFHLNIIVPTSSRSSRWHPSLSFSHEKNVCTFLSTMHATCFVHLIILDCITQVTDLKTSRHKSQNLCFWYYVNL
jgi:hypothetical protein